MTPVIQQEPLTLPRNINNQRKPRQYQIPWTVLEAWIIIWYHARHCMVPETLPAIGTRAY
jgi:hypothetical protein